MKVDYVIKGSWADKSRKNTEADILKRAGDIEGVAAIFAEEIVQIDGMDDTTNRIRATIDRNNHHSAQWLADLEVREHRRMVSTPLAKGLTHFSSKKELVSVLIDAIDAHHRLVQKNRDISLHNIMIHQPTPSNEQRREDNFKAIIEKMWR
ncbi:hypothetical protein CPB84DRAFT_1751742 [Gymnopilus junonius]|uniref:Fungal-type protein kinase domain-containing protein n=1 Tax=Gymnopilus junonius TaxID=109634 RepID=A0A9P5TGT5_GYMJU|nr:hypothetical protein CPB84DRAFT_1751742 [Gymnopilus junonius]